MCACDKVMSCKSSSYVQQLRGHLLMTNKPLIELSLHDCELATLRLTMFLHIYTSYIQISRYAPTVWQFN